MGPLDGACLNIKTKTILYLSAPEDGDISRLWNGLSPKSQPGSHFNIL